MFEFFRISRLYKFRNTYNYANNLARNGRPEAAFNEFNKLLKERSFNPYLRHELIMLGKKLKRPVKLPRFISYDEASRAKEALAEDLMLKDPNVVSIGTIEKVSNDGHKTGNYIVEVGVISSKKHAIPDESVGNGLSCEQMEKTRVDMQKILDQGKDIKKKYGPY